MFILAHLGARLGFARLGTRERLGQVAETTLESVRFGFRS